MRGNDNMNKRKILLLIMALLGCVMVSRWTKQVQAIDADITAIPRPITEMYDQRENSYVMYTETFSGYDLHNRSKDKFLKEYNYENVWKVEQDALGKEAIGGNLSNIVYSTKGNEYIYTTNLGFYGGDDPGDEGNYIIYRYKDNKWEVFVSHPIESLSREGYFIYERYIWNLTYYKGYIYYILVDNFDPSLGGAEDYYLYRASEQTGNVEKLGNCYSKFYIYNNKIYYMTQNFQYDAIRVFWEMNLDGSDKKIAHYQKRDAYNQSGDNYAVGGGSLYWIDENDNIRAINLKTKKEKIYAINFNRYVIGLHYESGKLYIENPISVYQLNLKSGDLKEFTEYTKDSAWVYKGCLYYIEHKNISEDETDKVHYYCRKRDLISEEIITWYETDDYDFSIYLEVLENNILIRKRYEYFMFDINEIGTIKLE